jgi:hypothetical protein
MKSRIEFERAAPSGPQVRVLQFRSIDMLRGGEVKDDHLIRWVFVDIEN